MSVFKTFRKDEFKISWISLKVIKRIEKLLTTLISLVLIVL